jgi:hypothetical protein
VKLIKWSKRRQLHAGIMMWNGHRD